MEKAEKGKQIIEYIAKKRNISEQESRRLLHLYVCQGNCDWYKNRRNPEEFNTENLTEKERSQVEKDILESGFELEEARKAIHLFICHK